MNFFTILLLVVMRYAVMKQHDRHTSDARGRQRGGIKGTWLD